MDKYKYILWATIITWKRKNIIMRVNVNNKSIYAYTNKYKYC